MGEIHGLFSGYGQVHKVILDISLPGRAWMVSCLILISGYLMHLYLQSMEIRGALNTILKLKGLKFAGGFQGSVDRQGACVQLASHADILVDMEMFLINFLFKQTDDYYLDFANRKRAKTEQGGSC